MNENFGYWEDEEDDVIGTYNPSDEDSDKMTDGPDNNELRLGFVRFVGVENGGVNVYELIFTHESMIDSFWGENFNIQPY